MTGFSACTSRSDKKLAQALPRVQCLRHACGERVFFVQDNWYNRDYVPRYQEIHRDCQNDRRDVHNEDHHGNQNDYHEDNHNDGRDHQGIGVMPVPAQTSPVQQVLVANAPQAG
jgi:hypothetical protein